MSCSISKRHCEEFCISFIFLPSTVFFCARGAFKIYPELIEGLLNFGVFTSFPRNYTKTENSWIVFLTECKSHYCVSFAFGDSLNLLTSSSVNLRGLFIFNSFIYLQKKPLASSINVFTCDNVLLVLGTDHQKSDGEGGPKAKKRFRQAKIKGKNIRAASCDIRKEVDKPQKTNSCTNSSQEKKFKQLRKVLPLPSLF